MYKIKKFIKNVYTNKFISPIIGFPLIFLQFLIRKEIVIIPMTNQPRISLWVTSTEYQLRRKNILGKKIYLIFLNYVNVSQTNKYLYEDLKKKSLVININTKIKFYLSKLFLFVFSRTNPKNIYFYNAYDIFTGLKKHFSFDNNQLKLANEYFNKTNLSKTKSIVILNTREHEYLYKTPNKISKKILIQSDENYYYRNQAIFTYEKSINFLLNKNYNVIKSGSIYSKKINIKNNNFLDYSKSKIKNQLMDLFLFYKSDFAIIGASGSWAYATLFDKPILYTGMYWPYSIPSKINDIFIMGMYFDKNKNKYLSIAEICNVFKKYNINDITNNFLQKLNIEFINNSEEDILEAVEEMYLRINNKWNDSKEYLYYKKHFNDIFSKMSIQRSNSFPNIGSKFLLKNKFLLN